MKLEELTRDICNKRTNDVVCHDNYKKLCDTLCILCGSPCKNLK